MRRSMLRLSLLAMVGLFGCTEPDSIELGQVCKRQEECKDPADTCMTLGGSTMCTMACSETELCPTDYACARTDVQVVGEGGKEKAKARGYCIAESRIGSHIATIKPKGSAKRKARRKARRARKAAKE